MKKTRNTRRSGGTASGRNKKSKSMTFADRADGTRFDNYGVLDGGLRTVSGVIDCKGERFGFVPLADGDLFIGGNNLCGARHGDTVRAIIIGDRPFAGGRRREGRVIEIVERNPYNIVATVEYVDNVFVAVPDDRHYGEQLEISSLGGASRHDKVIIELDRTYKGDMARVIAVLGRADEIGMDVKSVIAAHNLRTEFPRAALDQAEAYPDSPDGEECNKPYRRDFRDKTVFTIDGSDSKDFDDAISAERTDSGYRLGVYIADVAQYVTDRSPLDREAFARGTSVYLADRVIPMLPEKLSNGLCSLNEGEDRLTLAALIDLDENGNRTGVTVCEGVMRSSARLTYTGVQAIFDGDEALREKFRRVVPSLEICAELAKKRIAIRKSRGSIDFDLNETEIEFDAAGRVTDIRKKPRLFSMRIIEEFMILANCAVAETFSEIEKMPFVYRVHDRPKADKITAFNDYLQAVGAPMCCPFDPAPEQVAALLEKAPENITAAVARVALRSMQKADYEPTNKGHFGLAEPYYCHFTSPIRRYPDLLVHRIIKAYLHGGMRAAGKYRDFVAEAAEQSSKAERVAQDCERKTDDYKKAEYMSAHIGVKYTGIISSVTDFGFFVELPNTAEGLVRINTLPPAAYFDAKRLCIACGRAVFSLGDEVSVIVDGVEGDRINFLLA